MSSKPQPQAPLPTLIRTVVTTEKLPTEKKRPVLNGLVAKLKARPDAERSDAALNIMRELPTLASEASQTMAVLALVDIISMSKPFALSSNGSARALLQVTLSSDEGCRYLIRTVEQLSRNHGEEYRQPFLSEVARNLESPGELDLTARGRVCWLAGSLCPEQQLADSGPLAFSVLSWLADLGPTVHHQPETFQATDRLAKFVVAIWAASGPSAFIAGLDKILTLVNGKGQNLLLGIGAVVAKIPRAHFGQAISHFISSGKGPTDDILVTVFGKLVSWLLWAPPAGLAEAAAASDSTSKVETDCGIPVCIAAFISVVYHRRKYLVVENLVQQFLQRIIQLASVPQSRSLALAALLSTLIQYGSAFGATLASNHVGDLIKLLEKLKTDDPDHAESLANLLCIIQQLHSGHPGLKEHIESAVSDFQPPKDQLVADIIYTYSLSPAQSLGMSTGISAGSGTSAAATFRPSASLFYPTTSTVSRRLHERRLSSSPGVGLLNLGNTCYLNSIMQALRAATAFRRQILCMPAPAYTAQCVREVRRLLALLQTSSVACIKPQTVVQQCVPSWFSPGMQQDANEYFQYIMDALDRECRTVTGNPDWNPTSALTGKMVSAVRCKCGTVQQRQEAFTDIPVSVKPQASVQSQLDSFLQPECLYGSNEYFCDRCGANRPAKRQTRIITAPDILAITLLRFDYDPKKNARVKIRTNVSVSESIRFKCFSSLDEPGSDACSKRVSKADDMESTSSNIANGSTDPDMLIPDSQGDTAPALSQDPAGLSLKRTQTPPDGTSSADGIGNVSVSLSSAEAPNGDVRATQPNPTVNRAAETDGPLSRTKRRRIPTSQGSSESTQDGTFVECGEANGCDTAAAMDTDPDATTGSHSTVSSHGTHVDGSDTAASNSKVDGKHVTAQSLQADAAATPLSSSNGPDTSAQLDKAASEPDSSICDSIAPPFEEDAAPHEEITYNLCAVVVHSGYSAGSGHYYTYALSDKSERGQRQWALYNDSSVTTTTLAALETLTQRSPADTAYVLLYERAGTDQHGPDGAVAQDLVNYVEQFDREKLSTSSAVRSNSSYGGSGASGSSSSNGGGVGGGMGARYIR